MNWFKKWREAKRKEQEARDFDAGFLSACKAVLLAGIPPRAQNIILHIDTATPWAYEDGVRTAVSELRKLLDQVPK